MNVIIVAALALIVLIVLVFIFSDKMGDFGKGSNSCVNLGGKCTNEGYSSGCIASGTCECSIEINSNEKFIPGTDCEDKGRSQICCKKIF